jgi:hypothetical protein
MGSSVVTLDLLHVTYRCSKRKTLFNERRLKPCGEVDYSGYGADFDGIAVP